MTQGKEELILEAANRLFVKVGLKRSTVEAIAQEAGIGKGTVYLYFKKKEDIVVTLARRQCDEIMALVKAEGLKGDSAEEKLTKVFLVMWQHRDGVIQRFNLTHEFINEFRDQREIRLLEREYFVLWRQILEDIIREGMDGGEFRPAAPAREVATILWHAMESLDTMYVHTMGFAGIEKSIRTYIDLLMNGLKRR